MADDGEQLLNIFGAATIEGVQISKRPTQIQTRILERLALDHPAPVALVDLIAAVWNTPPPTHARAALQNQISRIRATWGAGTVITVRGGYSLGIATNLHRLRALVLEAETLVKDGEAERAFETADAALRIHSGVPFASLDHVPEVNDLRREITILAEMAANLRLTAGIDLERTVWSLAEAERLTRSSPHDEYRAALLARAYVLAGRRGDALASILAARHRLRDELGIDPGSHLTQIEEEIRRPQDDIPRSGPFIARQEELRQALVLLSAERLIRISAEPGGGISRFLLALYSQLRQLGVNPLLVDAASHQGSADAALKQLLTEARLTPDDRGVMNGFVDAIAKAPRLKPLSLIVDNADALGPTSLKVLIKTATLPGVTVVLGSHHLTGPEPSIRLPPLDESDVAGILRAAGKDPSRASALRQHSGGNPLAISLLLRHPALVPDEPAPPPASLHQLSDLLLAGLDRQEREVVERAAVFGSEIPIDGPVPETILIRDESGRPRFRHGVLRSLVYYDLAPASREELHLEAAKEARAARASNAIIAEHFLAAGPLAGEEAGRACRAAAEDAQRLGAHAEAALWWERAASTCSGRRHLLDKVSMGDAQRLAGDPTYVATLTDILKESLDSDGAEVLAEATYALLQIGSTTGDAELLAEIEPLLDPVLERVNDHRGQARVLAAASFAWSLVGQAERSRSFFLQAMALVPEPEPVRMELLRSTFIALGHPSDLNLRTANYRELNELAERYNDPASRFDGAQLGASIAFARGNGHALREHRRVMEETIDDVGDVARRWRLLLAQAAIAHAEGRSQESADLAEAAQELFSSVSPMRAVAAGTGQLFGLHLTQGRVRDLLPQLSALVESQPGIPAWHAALALALAEENDPRAMDHLHQAIDQAQPDVTWLASQATAARAAVLVGETTAIRTLTKSLTPWSGLGIWQGTCCYGPVDTTLGLLRRAQGDERVARSHFVQATEWSQRLGAPAYEQEATRLGLSEPTRDIFSGLRARRT